MTNAITLTTKINTSASLNVCDRFTLFSFLYLDITGLSLAQLANCWSFRASVSKLLLLLDWLNDKQNIVYSGLTCSYLKK